jgi:membrane associated rhomboid family serine protease
MEEELRVGRTRARAEEWALVLFSQGLASRIDRVPSGFALRVAAQDAERAEALLRVYELENQPAPWPREERAPPLVKGTAPRDGALAVVVAMVLFYLVTGPRNAAVDWFIAGSADSARIQAGEIWRVVTALTLHADAVHLIGNALFGCFFLAMLGRSLGPGMAFFLVVLAGAGGNLVNALLRSAAHSSVGASTSVFGAVGLLSGLGVALRSRRGDRWGRVLVPVAGGLGVLAMLGSAEGRVDVFAHLFGLLVGVPLGVLVGWTLRKPAGAPSQIAWGAGAVGALLLCWKLALA